ncbi:MAG: hypothetical protein IIY18_00345, partial [Clostridia bacterium]|nr:hypothetical protein [Clostridia bacterium]
MVKTKKLLAAILALCMMVQLFACVTMASAMTQVWDGTVAEGYTDGIGTADDPYIISSAAELAYMSAQVGAGVGLNAYYKLGADITFNENLLGEDGLLSKTPSVSFTPIGTSSNKFGGSFDGDGHTISGLYSYTNGYGGLFLYARGVDADNLAVIKNLKIVDSYVCSYQNEGSGILAAKAYYITVTDVEVQGYVTQFNNGKPVGLFFSQLEGVVYMENCVARGIASGNDSRDGITFNNKSVGYAGGFAGSLSGRDDKQFVSCANYADVYGISAGGFFGAASTINYRENYVSFTDCANYGNVTQFKYDNWQQNGNGAGGFIGSTSDSGSGSVPRIHFTRCLNKGDVAGNLFAAGFISRNGMIPWVDGATYSYTYTNCFNAGKLSLRITADEYSGDAAHVTDGKVLRTGDYVAYMTNTSGIANNVIITDSYAIPCGAEAAFNNATPDKIAVTGAVAYATEADYKAGAWLGADADRWTVTANGPELTFASSSKPEHTHVYTSEVTTKATCQTKGVLTYTCECGDTYTEAIPVVDHSYGEDNKCVWCGKYNPAIAYAAEVDGVRYDTFAEAYAAAAAGDTIVLLADLEASEIITIDKAITLDGNDKTLTSTAGRAINVDTTGDVTIENLTIVAKDERAINIINQPANVTVNNVTATAKNYAVNIATTAGAATVKINDSDLTGLAVVNVAGEGALVEINDTKLTNVDANSNENYGAITVYHTAENATINVNNCVITVSDDSRKAYIFAEGATVNGIDDVGMIVARIGDAGYETLEEALADVKAGETITLIRTAVIDEDMTIANVNIVAGALADPAIRIVNDATVTFENVTLDAAEYGVTLGASDFSSAGNLIVKSGTYHGNVSVISVTKGDLVIEGGNFSADPYQGNYAYLINCIDSSYKNGTATVTISGGNFANWNPQDNAAEGAGSNFCADGFDGVDNGDGTFGVVVHKHAYTAEVNEPTCTEAGKTIYTCRCGDTYEKEIPATGHTYVNGVCKCGDVEAPAEPVYDEAFKPATANVELESDYTIRFTVKTAVYNKYKNVYLVVEKEMFDGDNAIDPQIIKLTDAATITVNGEERYAYTVEGFAAKEIASEITATLYGEDENGN